MIAFLDSYRAGLFNLKNLPRNIFAGIIVGIVALPLSMAFAIASGVTPQEGLYTAIVAGICISLFGGSRVQIGGPTGAFIVILAGITAKYGIEGLQIASFMAGIILVLMGILKLGSVIKYIPEPVIIGFTAGIAVIIFVGQWKYFLGLNINLSKQPFYDQVFNLIKDIPDLNIHTCLLGFISLGILLIWPRVFFIKKIPAPLIALIFATLIQTFFKFPDLATLGSTFGEFPRNLPMPHWLNINFSEINNLMMPAFTIAMLGSIESLLSAVVADGMAGTKHNSNQELIGQGIANILSPLFGGFAATGAIARTATNIRNGGNSPLAGVIHSVLLIFMIIFLAPLAKNIPLTCLAAILFLVAYNMSEWRKFVLVCKETPYYDVLILWLTFLLTIFVNLVVAVNVGIILASLLFMGRMSEVFKINKNIKNINLENINSDSLIFNLEGPLFFGAVSHFEQVLEETHDEAKEIIFDLTHVPFIDGSVLIALKDTVRILKNKNKTVKFIGLNDRVLGKLKRAGLM